MKSAIAIAERGWSPDFATRAGIRQVIKGRLNQMADTPVVMKDMVAQMSEGPIAIATDIANEQHYEVPAAFFEILLGSRLKYSCSYYENATTTLDAAEQQMLDLTMQRAALSDGMDILELGCGWGSLTLAMASTFPGSQITAVSNSAEQRRFIEARAKNQGLSNINVITSDINDFGIDTRFDRVVSVEMFEHLRNYQLLFDRISDWLKPTGKLFFHIFCHRDAPYFYSDDTDNDWMARHFFTGGVMPSASLPLQFHTRLELAQQWTVKGNHYAKTCRDWLSNLDRNKAEALSALATGSNPEALNVQFHRWRLFVMACEELFSYAGGNEWFVSHYLFEKKSFEEKPMEETST